MNRISLGLNLVLIAAVGFLFYKVYQSSPDVATTEEKQTTTEDQVAEKTIPSNAVVSAPAGTPPTGKIAFINIDVINEESEEVKDLVAEAKRSKTNIEAAIQNLSQQYQVKLQEYEASAKAGIAPASVMQDKEREIMAIEKEAQNKQIQADNFAMSINEKNYAFQQNLKDFLVKWNQGRYDYILSYSDAVPTMLFGNATLDVTKEVIVQVNEEYKAKKNKLKAKK